MSLEGPLAAPRWWPALAYRAVVLALGLVGVGLLFEQLVDLLLLVAISVIIALPIAAGASWLERFHVPRAIGALLSLLVGLGAVALLLILIVPQFVSQVNGFVNSLPSTVKVVEHAVNHTFGLKPGTISHSVQRFVDRYTQHPAILLGPLSSVGISVAGAIGAVVVVLISSLYMAINPAPLVRGLVRLAPPAQRSEAMRILQRVRRAWIGWLRGVALDMLVLGVLLFIGMKVVGLQFAVGFAVFSALMTVIPNYGSVISAVPPILFGLGQSFEQGLLVAVVYVVVNQIEGNLVLPLIMGRVVSIHPAVIAIGVLISGALFGVLGLFISVPLMSLTMILVEEVWIRPREAQDALTGSGEVQAQPDPGLVPARGWRAAMRSDEARAQRAVLGAITMGAVLIVVGLLVQQLATLLIAVLITIIISLPMAWVAGMLERRGLPRPLGALIALVSGCVALGGILALLIPTLIDQVRALINNAPSLVHDIEVRVGHITGAKPGHVATQVQHDISTYLHNPGSVLGPIASIGLSAATIVGGLVIGVITAYYIAASPAPLRDGLLRLFAPSRREEARRLMRRLRAAWLGWLRGLLIAMALIGILLYLSLGLIVGLPFALFFSVFSAISEVIPYLGALASGIPPVAYALTISPGTAIEVLAIYIAVHQIEANVIGPLVMSRTVHLHPSVIAFGVIAVGEVFGFIGLIVAVPILSMVIILVEELWVRPREQHTPGLLDTT